jgi:hypothetical protein
MDTKATKMNRKGRLVEGTLVGTRTDGTYDFATIEWAPGWRTEYTLHGCLFDMGALSSCGEDDYAMRHGEWYCERHTRFSDWADAQDDEEDFPVTSADEGRAPNLNNSRFF